MYGAILGDIIGSPYEFDGEIREKDFPLFSEDSTFTDDTVMTLAVAEALMAGENLDDDTVRNFLTEAMRDWGNQYPYAGYGGKFCQWLADPDMGPYGSWGNGSAMRVSPAAWLYKDIETVRRMAGLSAEVTHDHPEGIKGAEATASAIFLARTGKTKAEIKKYIEDEFGYDLSRTCDEIRWGDRGGVSCMETVPEAITAFLEGDDFEDVVRTAVSLGGDTDTLGAIAGSIAEGFYGIPEDWKEECHLRLPKDLDTILRKFDERI